MIELYQWELSQFSEKVRLILDYKGLEYRKIEVTPGIGQVELFRLTGQQKVPVIKDGNRYVADSTAIAKYLDKEYPDRPLIPQDPKQRALTLLLEEWADETFSVKGRKVLFATISQDQEFRKSLLPNATPDIFKSFLDVVPTDFFSALGFGVGFTPDVISAAITSVQEDLQMFSDLLANNPYLTGDEPTLLDLTVASLSILIKFPDGPYLDLPASLRGKGLPAIADNPNNEAFFNWRDGLYSQFRKPLSGITRAVDSSPHRIEID
ncbi:glutathione S-transferase family protein [Anabaena sp. FACHB-1237]|uniref:glutathione S-transferase family protein n=1 Tax=Anabaena sp. FACHB-1237 TaxID=2692769 RepID=UPI00168161A5|nr:glutathione S-transferase family protein [Anabaena sp. FACHB-1237]MBD2138609.1 glutathione S-transferase family protein [Anabaena sp. FACHB-1237]